MYPITPSSVTLLPVVSGFASAQSLPTHQQVSFIRRAAWLLFLLCVGLLTTVHAQPVPVNTAIRFIKLGNTLREAKQYAEATSYLEKALSTLQRTGDRYWVAAANENLGLISRDLNDGVTANRYLTKAMLGYRAVKANLSAKVVEQILTGVTNPQADQEIYGGIDIGSKGVKMSVISLRFSPDGKPTLVVIKADSKNTTAMDGNAQVFANTAQAVKTYLDSLLIGRKIPRDRVFVVGSSGLKTVLEQPDKAGKLAELEQVLKTQLAGVWTEPIPFIDAAKEAELTIRGTLPESEWRSTNTIDIGSGNTKGGYYTADNKFEYIAFLGTGSLADYFKQNSKPAESAQAAYTEEFRQMVSEMMARKPEFQKRKRTYLVGGIVYALVTYLHPGEVNNSLVRFSYKDAVRFQELAMTNYDALINPDLTGIDGEATLKKAQSEAKNVQKIFTREQVIAGATLLRGILEECRGNNPGEKEFVFHRNGVIGWISGYIELAREKAFRQTKEQ